MLAFLSALLWFVSITCGPNPCTTASANRILPLLCDCRQRKTSTAPQQRARLQLLMGSFTMRCSETRRAAQQSAFACRRVVLWGACWGRGCLIFFFCFFSAWDPPFRKNVRRRFFFPFMSTLSKFPLNTIIVILHLHPHRPLSPDRRDEQLPFPSAATHRHPLPPATIPLTAAIITTHTSIVLGHAASFC